MSALEHGWHPIATAPKDGAAILLLCPDSVPDIPFIFVGSWLAQDHANDMGEPDEGWFSFDSEGWSWSVYPEYLPTHWMPLPPAPDQPA